MSSKQTLSFQAEVAQLLKLVTHSLYSNPEIFLRELVSNASDACDKLRFEALNDAGLYESDAELGVRVSFDKAAKTLTITDNGIGLSKQEAIDNLGTIAKSGTREFMSALEGEQKKDAQLIGQFGVGFYSAFMVADRVEVLSRKAGDSEGWRWVSDGKGSFTIEPAAKSAPSPTLAPSSTWAPFPMRARSPIVAPWMTALCAIEASRPISAGRSS